MICHGPYSNLSCVYCAMIVLVGCSSRQPVTRKSEQIRTVPVRTVAVARTQVQRTTRQPATVHAYYRAEIRARAFGFIKEIKADIGDHVDAGAELAVIDVPEMHKQRQIVESSIRRFEAEERRAQAGIELAAARVRSSKAKVAEARSQLNRVEATLMASQAEFSRIDDLVRRQSLQSRMLDEARMRRDSELASKAAAASSIDSAAAEVAVAEAQRASAHADLDAARAETLITRGELEELDVMMAYATVRAPFAGVVTYRNVELGDLIRESSEVASGRPLFVVSQVDKVRIRIPVPESAAPLVNQGDQIVLTFPSFAAEPLMLCSVTRCTGSLDPSTRTMMVEAEMSNADGKLLPGMFGQATISLTTNVAANMLPSRAVRFDETGKAYVYAVGQDETITIAQVATGINDGNSIEIISGVELGQRVVDAHLNRFSDGQKVAVLE